MMDIYMFISLYLAAGLVVASNSRVVLDWNINSTLSKIASGLIQMSLIIIFPYVLIKNYMDKEKEVEKPIDPLDQPDAE